MSFRDSMFVFISACPEDQIPAVLEILDDHNMSTEEVVATGDLVFSPSSYADHDSTGDVSSLADALIEAAPGIYFEAYSCPECEYGGTIVRYTPLLGRWSAAVDTEGEPVFSVRDVLRFVGMDTSSIRRACGEEHRDRLNALDRMRTAS